MFLKIKTNTIPDRKNCHITTEIQVERTEINFKLFISIYSNNVQNCSNKSINKKGKKKGKQNMQT